MEQETQLVSAVALADDGHASERSLTAALLALAGAGELWLADRNFCSFPILFGIAAHQACFVMRQHGSIKGTLHGRRRLVGPGPSGRVFEQPIELTHEGQTVCWRHVTLELAQPTRDGDRVIHLLTNLPAAAANARMIGELYGRRWTVEVLFLEVATTLEAELNTLCYPKAALFAFCLGLVAANAVALLKAAARAALGEEQAAALSPYYLTREIRQNDQGMMVAIPPERWAVSGGQSVAAFAAQLTAIAAHIDVARYRRTPRGPKKPPPRKEPYQNGGHIATGRLLKQRRY